MDLYVCDILLVDDNRELQEMLRELLEREGYSRLRQAYSCREARELFGRREPELVILDPPRDGIHPRALEKIGTNIRAERMVYISCKPTSLARDLVVLQEYGYKVERICCVDMFPGTGNVETVVLLSNRKSKPDTHVKLSLSMDDYYRIKDEGRNNQ